MVWGALSPLGQGRCSLSVDPVLEGGVVLQLVIAAHLEITEVHLPQPRQRRVGHVAVDGHRRVCSVRTRPLVKYRGAVG